MLNEIKSMDILYYERQDVVPFFESAEKSPLISVIFCLSHMITFFHIFLAQDIHPDVKYFSILFFVYDDSFCWMSKNRIRCLYLAKCSWLLSFGWINLNILSLLLFYFIFYIITTFIISSEKYFLNNIILYIYIYLRGDH